MRSTGSSAIRPLVLKSYSPQIRPLALLTSLCDSSMSFNAGNRSHPYFLVHHLDYIVYLIIDFSLLWFVCQLCSVVQSRSASFNLQLELLFPSANTSLSICKIRACLSRVSFRVWCLQRLERFCLNQPVVELADPVSMAGMWWNCTSGEWYV